ncbi:MAG: hypothetical protein JZU65_06060, partial [Chlorobium sp.]|nr:hypothetical protein [Chlorobium sp.]
MKTSSQSAYRGDTVKVPVLVTIPEGVTIRIHLRQNPESETFYNLAIVGSNVVIPEVISAACLGIWGFDIETTDGSGEVATLQRSRITFGEDYTRTYGSEASELTSDLERRVIIAKEFKFRKLDNTLESIPTLEDMTAITGAEAVRLQNETTRQSQESGRVTAETTRGNNET